MEIDKSIGISIIVCCYNSVSRLTETLNHLAQQKVSNEIQWEIIVVDNASTDNTATAALELWSSIDLGKGTLRVISQNTPGLIYARHSGVKAAKYEFVLFCDDDNWLGTNYVATAYKTISRNPTVGAIGGIGIPEFEPGVTPPEWFHNSYGLYALGPQGQKTGILPKNSTLYGAGLITRKSLYLATYPVELPSMLNGRTGISLASGEDTEYCFRLRLSNHTLLYNETLRFKHYIPKERLTENYKNRILNSTKDSQKQLRRYQQLLHYKNKSNFSKILRLVMTIMACLAGKILNRPSWSYNDVIRAVFYATKLDLGIDEHTKKIYYYYSKRNIETADSVIVCLSE